MNEDEYEYTPTMTDLGVRLGEYALAFTLIPREQTDAEFARALAIHDAEVRRDEREKCAQIASDYTWDPSAYPNHGVVIAAAIRARSEEADRG